jgi:hypothetical protein
MQNINELNMKKLNEVTFKRFNIKIAAIYLNPQEIK